MSAIYDQISLGFEVIVSRNVEPPREPTTKEWATRLVRHGFAQQRLAGMETSVMDWLDLAVGPHPEDLVHTIYVVGKARQIICHPAFARYIDGDLGVRNEKTIWTHSVLDFINSVGDFRPAPEDFVYPIMNPFQGHKVVL